MEASSIHSPSLCFSFSFHRLRTPSVIPRYLPTRRRLPSVMTARSPLPSFHPKPSPLSQFGFFNRPPSAAKRSLPPTPTYPFCSSTRHSPKVPFPQDPASPYPVHPHLPQTTPHPPALPVLPPPLLIPASFHHALTRLPNSTRPSTHHKRSDYMYTSTDLFDPTALLFPSDLTIVNRIDAIDPVDHPTILDADAITPEFPLEPTTESRFESSPHHIHPTIT